MFEVSIPEAWKALPGRRHVLIDDCIEHDFIAHSKKCNCCDEVKPEEDFTKLKSGKLRSYCRVCMTRKSTEWKARNREHVNAYQRERKLRLKA